MGEELYVAIKDPEILRALFVLAVKQQYELLKSISQSFTEDKVLASFIDNTRKATKEIKSMLKRTISELPKPPVEEEIEEEAEKQEQDDIEKTLQKIEEELQNI